MNLEPPLSLVCTEYRVRLTNGSLSQPLIVGAEDDTGTMREVVLKVRTPDRGVHFGPTSLACELICAILARALNLPVPQYAIVEIPPNFPDVVPDPDIKNLLAANIGENFATIYQHGYSIWFPAMPKSSSVLDDLEEFVGFDTVVLNHDRTAQKPNLLVKGEDFMLIDHSLALHPLLPANYLMDAARVLKHCSARVLYQKSRKYEEPGQRWKVQIGTSDLDRLRSLIPTSWETKPGELDKIFDFLSQRPLIFSHNSQHLRSVLL
jgi:hypothetical protein